MDRTEISVSHVVWSGSQTVLGVTVNARVLYLNKKFYFEGDGSGHGHTVPPYRREITGNMDWSGVIGKINNTDVHLWIRIKDWNFTGKVLTCNLYLWGAYGNGPWVPVGGLHFKVFGHVPGFVSAAELLAFLTTDLGPILDERELLTEEDPPALAA